MFLHDTGLTFLNLFKHCCAQIELVELHFLVHALSQRPLVALILGCALDVASAQGSASSPRADVGEVPLALELS